MRTNYHSHTALCNHAEGSVEENVKYAIEAGYDVFGISEHTPLTTVGKIPPKYIFERRMKLSDLDEYIKNVNYCKEKYKDQIKILVGLEAEYFPTHHDFFKEIKDKVDYLVFGNHNFIYNGKFISSFNVVKKEHAIEYAKNALEAFKTGFYKFMAHPDLYLLKYKWNETSEKVAEMIAKASIKYDMPLELNANGMRRGILKTDKGDRYYYPRQEFWEIVRKYNCKVVVNSDAHEFIHHNDEFIQEAYKLAKEWKLNVIDVLE